MVIRLSQTYGIEKEDYKRYPFLPEGANSVEVNYDEEGRLESILFMPRIKGPDCNLSKDEFRKQLLEQSKQTNEDYERLNPERTPEEVKKIAGLLDASAVSIYDIPNLFKHS